MAKSKTYTLEYLNQYIIPFPNNTRLQNKITPKGLLNGLVTLFPVDKKHFHTIASPTAFLCICGNIFVCDRNAVFSGRNKSCGCFRKTKAEFKWKIEVFGLARKRNMSVVKMCSGYRIRDLTLKCLECGHTSDKLAVQCHLINDKKFCKCSSHYRATYEEIKDQCNEFSLASTWNIVSFPEQYNKKDDLRIALSCKHCPYTVNMLYGNYMAGKSCKLCMLKSDGLARRKDTAYFIEKSIMKHGLRYDYSKTEYVKAREPVEIICEEHGPFWQSPDNHYNKGKGCRKCRDKANIHVSFHKARVVERKETYLTIPSGVYITSVGDTTKLGLSVNPIKRAKEIKNHSKLPTQVMYSKAMSLYDAFMLEYSLHEHFKEYPHNFKVSEEFQGHTECFDLSAEQILETRLLIDNYKVEGQI